MSVNVLIFFYGIAVQTRYHVYLNEIQGNYLLDSALVLAIHDAEDNNSTDINRNFVFNGKNIGYTINKIDDKNVYVKVFYNEKNKIKYREYLKKYER
jgi:hypothetical protein